MSNMDRNWLAERMAAIVSVPVSTTNVVVSNVNVTEVRSYVQSVQSRVNRQTESIARPAPNCR